MRVRAGTAAVALLLFGALLYERSHASTQAAPAVVRAEAIELVDQQGRVRAQLNVSPDGQVVFRLRDEQGTVRVKLGADENGSGLLLLDATTNPGVHALATRARTGLTLQRGAKRRVLRP
jgi:hypothetical protein